MSKEEMMVNHIQLVAALNLISTIGDLEHYPLVRDVLIPHRSLAKELLSMPGIDKSISYDAERLLYELDKLHDLYYGRK